LGATSLQGGSAENQFLKNALGDVGDAAARDVPGRRRVRGGAPRIMRRTVTPRGRRSSVPGCVQGLKDVGAGQLIAGAFDAGGRVVPQASGVRALDVAGGVSAVGRVAGAVARGAGSTVAEAGARGALARAGSTVRPAIGLNEDGGVAHVQRAYSKDVTRKAAQVAADKAREPLLDAEGRSVTVMDRGREVPVLKAPSRGSGERLLRGRADMVASRANSVERLVRDEAGHEEHATRAGRGRGRMSRLAKPRSCRGRSRSTVRSPATFEA
jgi:hypothetical protein